MPSRTKPPVKTNYCNPAAIKTRNGVPRAAQHNPPGKAHANDDANSIADEEEVIFELDEVALSNLPLHLQNTMREIQLERVHRLQKECRQNIHLRMRSHESNRYENEKVYAERWYQNMLAKVAAARELEAQIMNEYDPSISRPEGMTWCPVRHAWVPASCGLRGTVGLDMGTPVLLVYMILVALVYPARLVLRLLQGEDTTSPYAVVGGSHRTVNTCRGDVLDHTMCMKRGLRRRFGSDGGRCRQSH
ncbi:uncharacterized protein BJX67DRAFT_363172 [Aspergillus lucknowensis]|uniref:Uncharacterized protein n=1 Tax=Aspergillus lucknowensis TaxID=176173 RepID=A0ABR4LGM9_9EURO